MDNIYDSKYSTLDFLHRLHLIQKTVEQAGVDALVLINGGDGLENVESTNLMNWLFKGNNGSIIATDTYLHPLFEESFMAISANSWSLFGPDALFKAYFKEMTAAPNRNLVIFKEAEAEADRDGFEIIKIKEFFRTVENCKIIGMLLNEDRPKEFKKQIENIPLVQSYGLDG